MGKGRDTAPATTACSNEPCEGSRATCEQGPATENEEGQDNAPGAKPAGHIKVEQRNGGRELTESRVPGTRTEVAEEPQTRWLTSPFSIGTNGPVPVRNMPTEHVAEWRIERGMCRPWAKCHDTCEQGTAERPCRVTAELNADMLDAYAGAGAKPRDGHIVTTKMQRRSDRSLHPEQKTVWRMADEPWEWENK
jgi:hypothetical protein